ncbi:hypothetical protein [Terrimonas alba]|uniref:hypothetical protein n=1 Tax=Terrimonas alba TaxID=3349636 RepID=UPI0035F245B2
MRHRLGLVVFVLVCLFSCSEKEELPLEPLSDYLPLAPGKYITYRIDSLVFTDFQRNIEIHSYQVRHQVDTLIADNLGRPTYRVYRFLRNADGTGEWTNNGSYFVTPLQDRIEVIEDNLRFIKLHAPLREGYNWKGNSYLHLDPYESFSFTLFGYMKNWDYNYDSFESSFTYDGQEYTDVWTVEEENSGENFPVTAPARPGGRIRAVEKYAKNIGLVYREYMIAEYEPNTSGPDPYYRGFGITMWMIDHN